MSAFITCSVCVCAVGVCVHHVHEFVQSIIDLFY